MSWRSFLPELLASENLRTQADICASLAARGFRVDQAAVSRELHRAGATKVGGAYRIPEGGPRVPIHTLIPTAGGCLVVVRTEPAYAMVLAQAIDAAHIDGVLGTVAGDDTVFVATTGEDGGERLARWLGFTRP